MKSLYAIQKNSKVHIQAYADTTTGMGIAYGPVFTCEQHDVGVATSNIRLAFQHSISGVAHPNQDAWKEVQRPMLEAVGAKSWKALAKGAKAIGIQLENGMVNISPSANYENQGGKDLPGEVISLPYDSNELGAKLIEAFSLSS
jgi:hypothetical protein